MTTCPLVSCICLTTHPKRTAFLPDALRAYRQQMYPSKELIIVNDGAPIVSLAADVKVVQMPPRAMRWTIGEKRNEGVRAARGEFLATWDDDDVSFAHRLDRSVACALAWNADAVLADRMMVATEDLQLAGDCDRGDGRAVMASALLRRDAVVAVGGYDVADYREDVALLERMRLVGRCHVATIQDADWYVLRRHDGNITVRYGESNAQYLACGRRSPEVTAQQAMLDSLLCGPGGEDVVGWDP